MRTRNDSFKSLWAFYAWGFLTALIILGVQLGRQDAVGKADAANLVSPLPTGEVVYSVEHSQYTQEEIEDYIRVIFGKDARVAIAVSHKECNPKNPSYPACVLHTEHEYSVGVLQINLYNTKHWIHAAKVPGDTMEQKIEWLKNPFNNVLIAHKIFADSGFQPWTAYTSGAYKEELE